MSYNFENKDIASKAGKKSGKTLKTRQWEALGDFLTEKGAERAMEVLDSLADMDYLEQYGKLLNYFKPKQQSTSIDANVKTDQMIEYKNVSKQFPDK